MTMEELRQRLDLRSKFLLRTLGKDIFWKVVIKLFEIWLVIASFYHAFVLTATVKLLWNIKEDYGKYDFIRMGGILLKYLGIQGSLSWLVYKRNGLRRLVDDCLTFVVNLNDVTSFKVISDRCKKVAVCLAVFLAAHFVSGVAEAAAFCYFAPSRMKARVDLVTFGYYRNATVHDSCVIRMIDNLFGVFCCNSGFQILTVPLLFFVIAVVFFLETLSKRLKSEGELTVPFVKDFHQSYKSVQEILNKMNEYFGILIIISYGEAIISACRVLSYISEKALSTGAWYMAYVIFIYSTPPACVLALTLVYSKIPSNVDRISNEVRQMSRISGNVTLELFFEIQSLLSRLRSRPYGLTAANYFTVTKETFFSFAGVLATYIVLIVGPTTN